MLGCTLDAHHVCPTPTTPFDGAYAPSNTRAIASAAPEDVARQIKAVAEDMTGVPADDITLRHNYAWIGTPPATAVSNQFFVLP